MVPPRTFDISHSDISAFLACKRQWWFSYVLGFSDARFPVGAASAGTRVHEALEAHYETPTNRDATTVFETLAQRDIALATDTNQPPWVMEKLYDDILLGRRMVTDYLSWLQEHQPDAEWEPVCTEAKMRYTIGLDDPVWYLIDHEPAVDQRNYALAKAGYTGIRLQGKVDLVQQHASTRLNAIHEPRFGQLRATDWKTTGRTFQVDEGFQRSNQSYVYDMLLEMAQEIPPELETARQAAIGAGSPPPDFNFRIIQRPRSRNAPTEIRDLAITHSANMRRSRRRQIFSTVADLIDTTLAIDAQYPNNPKVHTAERHAPPSPSDACGWCSFRIPCDVVDDGPDVAVAMVSTSPDYTSGQRHQRYADSPESHTAGTTNHPHPVTVPSSQ